MEQLIKIPHLKINKLVADPAHTKKTIVYLVDQMFKLYKQKTNIEWCIVIKENNKQRVIQQPIIPNHDVVPGYIWNMYFYRSKEIWKYNAGLYKGDTLGDNPKETRIIITLDGNNYDFDDSKKDIEKYLRSRIRQANMWIWEIQKLRNIELRSKGKPIISDEITRETFDNDELLLNLHIVDCLYESMKMKIGKARLDRIQKRISKIKNI